MSGSANLSSEPDESGQSLFDAYLRGAAESDPLVAMRAILVRLPTDSPLLWLECARCMMAGGHPLPAAGVLQSAAARFGDSLDVRYWLAVALWHADQVAPAEAMLRDLVAAQPTYPGAAMQLAILLRSQGRMEAATATMEALHAVAVENEIRLECVRFIAGCQRQNRAAVLMDKDIAAGTGDPVMLAIGGNLAQEVGHFDIARTRFLAALDGGIDLNAWFVAFGLAETQRYSSGDHPDFALFEGLLERNLSPDARAAVLFALAKAYDDVGDYARATIALRKANALVRTAHPWSRDDWHAQVEATIEHSAPAIVSRLQPNWSPVFIVGLPRTGTTLIAELLGRHPWVRNRGELPTLPFVAKGLAASGRTHDQDAVDETASVYAMHMRQDDAPARIYIDKNPMNFQHVGLIARLFPQARVIHCRRDIRDTALSLWCRLFAHDDYGFSYDFEDIAAFAQGHDRLMAHWKRVLPLNILDVSYEDLVADSASAMARILDYLKLPDFDLSASAAQTDSVIASTSRWQARQPIYQRSVQRWKAYSPYLPELTTAFTEAMPLPGSTGK
ncbi:MAG: sulfotransferase [Dokdonella sp.]